MGMWFAYVVRRVKKLVKFLIAKKVNYTEPAGLRVTFLNVAGQEMSQDTLSVHFLLGILLEKPQIFTEAYGSIGS